MPTQQELDEYYIELYKKRGMNYITVGQIMLVLPQAIQEAYNSLPINKQRLSKDDVEYIKKKTVEILKQGI